MFRSCSEPVLIALALATAAGPLTVAAAQEVAPAGGRQIMASHVVLSRDEAVLTLEFTDGQSAEFSIHDGQAWLDGEAIAEVERGSELDRSWRDLLGEAMEASGDELAGLLADWDAPGDAALEDRLDVLLQAAPARNAGEAVEAEAEAPDVDVNVDIDSVERMTVRIRELQERVHELEGIPATVQVVTRARANRGGWWETGPFRHFFRSIAGIVWWAIFYAVVFGIAFATIFFGGRRYIEAVADTARTATTRSLLVGLAASFLVVPAFILGIIALAISIVGIPVLIAWVPLFPVAVGLAILLGYIGVAHAAGEALAERRFYATDWFQRGNSYYFLMTGLGLLVAPFIAANIVGMAGPMLSFLGGAFTILGAVVMWAALSIGLGAVLLTRGGTRPGTGSIGAPDPEIYAESTRV
jgi:tetrahydromethanopterin S-methyltransferase subunit B